MWWQRVVAAVAMVADWPVASGLDNGLGLLPIRGVSSWCVQGECGWDRCWDAQYRSIADAMVEEGLQAAVGHSPRF